MVRRSNWARSRSVAACTIRSRELLVAKEAHDPGRHRLAVPERHEKSRNSILDGVVVADDVGQHDRSSAPHRLQGVYGPPSKREGRTKTSSCANAKAASGRWGIWCHRARGRGGPRLRPPQPGGVPCRSAGSALPLADGPPRRIPRPTPQAPSAGRGGPRSRRGGRGIQSEPGPQVGRRRPDRVEIDAVGDDDDPVVGNEVQPTSCGRFALGHRDQPGGEVAERSFDGVGRTAGGQTVGGVQGGETGRGVFARAERAADRRVPVHGHGPIGRDPADGYCRGEIGRMEGGGTHVDRVSRAPADSSAAMAAES